MNYCISPTIIALTFRNFNDFKTRELKQPLGNQVGKKSSLWTEWWVVWWEASTYQVFIVWYLHVAGTDPVILEKIVSHVPNSPRQDGGLTRIATIHPNSRTSREGSNPTKTRTGTPRPSTANYDSRLRSWWWSSEVRWRRCRCGWR